MKHFKGVYPISGEDLNALPVKAIVQAVEFYRSVLGFSVVASDEETAALQRDDARIGLVRKPDHKPGEAGSFAIAVADLDAMHRELDGRGLDLGGIRIDEWDGKRYRVFFLREAENGYCYCFSQPVDEGLKQRANR
jgi:catechol 2,3-dioxygenase-like lactoylglutathione lyase family enzyme